MLKQGDIAPDFTLNDQNMEPFHLYEALEQNSVVLFFYPMAFTPGCTQESCSFRNMKDVFEQLGAIRVGISANRPGVQKRFAQSFKLDFPVLSDHDKKVAALYGVKRLGLPVFKRSTFVISKERKILGVIVSEFDVEKHVNEAITLLRQHKEHSS
jgi:peroxiredoxin Q/BCP